MYLRAVYDVSGQVVTFADVLNFCVILHWHLPNARCSLSKNSVLTRNIMQNMKFGAYNPPYIY